MGTRAESPRGGSTPSLADRLESVARVVRTILGVPDYERYVKHMRSHHPSEQPLSRDEFLRERQEDRYSRPGSRCC
jgi:uncharacterized short protein YbdD (DUF466 family)